MAEPILKWAGGKRQLITEITATFPSTFQNYHEPMVGGGAVFFHLEPEGGTINDLNSRLVNFYRVVRDHPAELIAENNTHEHSKAYFYNARDEFNRLGDIDDKSEDESIQEASLLLYLNRTCFNGLYRENSDGEFNVPFGSYKNPNYIQRERILEASDVLKKTEIYNEQFNYVVDAAESGDLVYIDPPYQPVSPTASFTQYNAEDFDKDDQRDLRDVAVELSTMGVSVVISNSPPISELYEDIDGFQVVFVEATRAINSDASNRHGATEIIITNVSPDNQQRQTLSEFS